MMGNSAANNAFTKRTHSAPTVVVFTSESSKDSQSRFPRRYERGVVNKINVAQFLFDIPRKLLSAEADKSREIR